MTNDFDLKGKAREWFLYESVSEDKDTLTAVPRGNDPYDQYANMITVIEKSAYDNLRRQVSIYEKALERIATMPGNERIIEARAALEEGRK